MKLSNTPVLIVSGVPFIRAYAGTVHLARALYAADIDVKILVESTEDEACEYATLDLPVSCLIYTKQPWFLRKLETLVHRSKVFIRILRSSKVIITENRYLLEASIAKWLAGDRLVLGHYCQELHLPEEYPNIPRIALLSRLASVPDFVVDVEPNRARVRMERLGLRKMPIVLRNTLHAGSLPQRTPQGTLARLADRQLPQDRPILIHMGGIGREKPLERVIDAVAMCKAPVFFLAFCNGSTEQIAGLNHYASRKLSTCRFAILGPRKREELLDAAWEADIGIVDYSPSVEDTSNQRYCAPTKLYEFMALGLAVVGSDNDSLRDIIVMEDIGECAEDGSTAALAAALERAVHDPDRLRSMKARATRCFQSRHSYEALCLPAVQQISRAIERNSDS